MTGAPSGDRIRLALVRPGFTLDVDLALPPVGATVLFGRSGSGKTTLLRAVAGLERGARGAVRVGGADWQDDARGVFEPAWRRPVGYVFQDAGLFAHLDVRGNLDYAARRARKGSARSPGDGAAALPMDDLVDLLGIGALLARRTQDLSGGERQRVAIARALASRPRLLLLDEPLAALDAARRQEILPWLERLRDEARVPMLYVTHSADEMARLATTLVVIDDGRVAAAGPAAEVLPEGAATAVLGDEAGALLNGTIGVRDERWHLMRVDFFGGALWLRDTGAPIGRSARVRVLARDISLALSRPADSSVQNLIECNVEEVRADAHPSQALVFLRCLYPGGRMSPSSARLLARITARSAAELSVEAGSRVWAQVKAAALVT